VLAAPGISAAGHPIRVVQYRPLLLVIVTVSYRQTIFAYPSGGGSYIVAPDNLGRLPGLVAALLIDYVLTVAVSITLGVAALISAVPVLDGYAVPLGIAFIFILALGNLRGVHEAGVLFAAPTYAFITSLLALVAIGFVRVMVLHDLAATGVPREPVPTV
jgi:amino acid transporter